MVFYFAFSSTFSSSFPSSSSSGSFAASPPSLGVTCRGRGGARDPARPRLGSPARPWPLRRSPASLSSCDSPTMANSQRPQHHQRHVPAPFHSTVNVARRYRERAHRGGHRDPSAPLHYARQEGRGRGEDALDQWGEGGRSPIPTLAIDPASSEHQLGRCCQGDTHTILLHSHCCY